MAKTKYRTILIPDAIWDELSVAAGKQNRNRSWLIKDALAKAAGLTIGEAEYKDRWDTPEMRAAIVKEKDERALLEAEWEEEQPQPVVRAAPAAYRPPERPRRPNYDGMREVNVPRREKGLPPLTQAEYLKHSGQVEFLNEDGTLKT